MRSVVVKGFTSRGIVIKRDPFSRPIVCSRLDEDEAVRIANDAEYGLSPAPLWKDLAMGLRLAKRTDGGAAHAVARSWGVKSSGFGRSGSARLRSERKRIRSLRIRCLSFFPQSMQLVELFETP